MLDSESIEIKEFLAAWHENGRNLHERMYPNLPYDTDQEKHAHTRRSYVACDCGSSGVFLVDRLTHNVYKIKAYGVKGYFVGTIESLTMRYREATETNAKARAKFNQVA